MAKKKSLAWQRLETHVVKKRMHFAWHDKIREKHPEEMAEIESIVDRFFSKDPEVIAKLPSQREVAFFVSELATELGVSIKPSSLHEYLKGREALSECSQ